MEKFVIIADSTCDLTAEFREKYDIKVIRASRTSRKHRNDLVPRLG